MRDIPFKGLAPRSIVAIRACLNDQDGEEPSGAPFFRRPTAKKSSSVAFARLAFFTRNFL
jgi:hypothetical protein